MSAELAAKCLVEHPWVADVCVGPESVLHVEPAQAALALLPEPGPLLAEYLEHWADVYDWVYERSDGQETDDLDLSGWRASDTGLPLPVDHMTEWIDRTVELVLRTRPRLVLEPGCGTGLLLHRLHRHVSAYVGTDVSTTAVARLRSAELPGVAVVQAAAHETGSERVRDALTAGGGRDAWPDCVLLNSVTQHFPNTEYLSAVLSEAIGMVSERGTVVVGDIRHLGLLSHYSLWLEVSRDPSASIADIVRRAEVRAAREEEFLADPRLLAYLASRCGRTVHMSVHPKTMQADTELTRYRYDVILHVDPAHAALDPEVVPWSALQSANRLMELRRRAAAGHPVLIAGIPNSLLVCAEGAVSPFELRQAVVGLDADVCIDTTDPTLLSVAAPAAAGRQPAEHSRLPQDQPTAHEPLPRFVERRLLEVLRDHLRRVGLHRVKMEIDLP